MTFSEELNDKRDTPPLEIEEIHMVCLSDGGKAADQLKSKAPRGPKGLSGRTAMRGVPAGAIIGQPQSGHELHAGTLKSNEKGKGSFTMLLVRRSGIRGSVGNGRQSGEIQDFSTAHENARIRKGVWKISNVLMALLLQEELGSAASKDIEKRVFTG